MLKQAEMLHPDAKMCGLLKGKEKIYLKKDVYALRAMDEWKKRGRIIKAGEKGKVVSQFVDGVRERAVLYAVWQTDELSARERMRYFAGAEFLRENMVKLGNMAKYGGGVQAVVQNAKQNIIQPLEELVEKGKRSGKSGPVQGQCLLNAVNEYGHYAVPFALLDVLKAQQFKIDVKEVVLNAGGFEKTVFFPNLNLSACFQAICCVPQQRRKKVDEILFLIKVSHHKCNVDDAQTPLNDFSFPDRCSWVALEYFIPIITENDKTVVSTSYKKRSSTTSATSSKFTTFVPSSIGSTAGPDPNKDKYKGSSSSSNAASTAPKKLNKDNSQTKRVAESFAAARKQQNGKGSGNTDMQVKRPHLERKHDDDANSDKKRRLPQSVTQTTNSISKVCKSKDMQFIEAAVGWSRTPQGPKRGVLLEDLTESLVDDIISIEKNKLAQREKRHITKLKSIWDQLCSAVLMDVYVEQQYGTGGKRKR